MRFSTTLGLLAALLIALGVLAALLIAIPACTGDDDESGQARPTTGAAVDIYAVGEVLLRTEGKDDVPLEGITVVMTPEGGGKEIRRVSQRGGTFSVRSMPPGTYDVTLEGLGPGQEFEPLEVSVAEDVANAFLPPLVVSE